MANGTDVIKQVRQLLENPDNMSQKTANVMTLTLLADLYEKWQTDHTDLEAVKESVEKMQPIVKIVQWVGGAIGLADIGFLWALLTHTGPFASK